MKYIKHIKMVDVVKWFCKVLGYTLILMSISMLFKNSIYIDNSYYGIWCLFISIIIYLLNKTIKPIIFWLTLPITGLTLGLFYPCINVVILYLVAFITGSHFDIPGNILVVFLIAVIISLMNFMMNEIINWLFRKEK